jgi:hypothetical protein
MIMDSPPSNLHNFALPLVISCLPISISGVVLDRLLALKWYLITKGA